MECGTLLAIYELGMAPNCVEENGFGMAKLGEGEEECWVLVETPDSSYVIPDTVSGIQVDKVSLTAIKGEAIFTQGIEFFENSDTTMDGCELEKITLQTTDYEFIFNINGIVKEIELDLTACGGNVQIPANYLEDGRYADNFSTIYVTSEVKEKYPDNAKVQVKSE